MEWQDFALQLNELLALEGSPVAITYSLDPLPQSEPKNRRVCEALLDARAGEIFEISPETSQCRGGSMYLGFVEFPKGEESRPLKEFLVHGEKLFCSPAVFQRMRSMSPPPPTGLADHVIFCPMEKSELRPDIVLFICNAEQACRLVTLDMYDRGIPPRIHMAGATCYQTIAYPIVTGEMNVSLMDYTSRRIKGYKPQDLIVSIPYHRLPGVMRSIEHCTAGKAPMEIPDSFRRMLQPEGGDK